MPDGNPLIAQAQSQTTGVTGIGIAEAAQGLAHGVSDGDWVEAGLSAVGVGLEVLSMVIDPIGTLASYGVSWLIEHVRPLKEALDWFAGDPPVIQSFSDTWGNVATEVNNVAKDFLQEAGTGTSGWTGPAADAYRGHAAETADAVSGAATLADGISAGVMIMGQVVSFVREFIRDLVGELVGRLISWALEEVASLGLATPLVVAQATAAITKVVNKVSDVIRRLVKTIGNVSPRIRKIIDKLDEIMAKLAKLMRKADGSTSPSAARSAGKHADDAPKVHGSDGSTTPSHATSPSGSTADAPPTRNTPDGTSHSPGGTDGSTSPSGADTSPSGNGTPSTGKDEPNLGDGKREGGQRSEGNGKCENGIDPIDPVSGQMITAVTDVELPGLLPLILRRAYASGYVGGRLLGPGWSSTVDQRIQVDADGVHFAGDDAQILHYPRPTRTNRRVLPTHGARWPLTWDADTDSYRIEDPATGWVRHFDAPAANQQDPNLRPITALTDRNRHQVTYVHDDRGLPTLISHSGGYQVGVDTIATPAGDRIAGFRLLDGANNGAGTPIVQFRHVSGRLTEIVNSTGLSYTYAYDGDGRITSWTDRNGYRYEYHYRADGRVTHGVGPDGYLSGSLDYDLPRRVTTITDSVGARTEYHYDADNHLTRIVDPLGGATRTEYDGDGRPLARTDELGNTTRYQYDEHGNVTRVELPTGAYAENQFDGLGRPTVIRGPDGAVWRYAHDQRGNLVASIDPTGAITSYAYDDRGNLTAVTDAVGNRSQLTSDARGLVTQVTDAAGRTTRFVRDAFGRVAEVVDAAGAVTRTRWTVEGLPLWRTLPGGGREEWTYDAEGHALTYRGPSGHDTTFTYQQFDLPTSRTGRDGARYEFAYDTELRLTSVTNPTGRVWRYEYDAKGRLVTETDFNGRQVSYTHDAAGNLVERVNGAGQRVGYVRDALGRTLERRVGDRTTTLAYDGAGRLMGAASPDTVVDYERDPLGRIVAESVNGRTLRTMFDRVGRRVVRTTPAGAVTKWQYDATGRPTRLTTNSAGAVGFEYDAAGREVTRHLGPHAGLTQAWDEAGRLVTQSVWSDQPRPGARYALAQQRTYAYRTDGAPLRTADRLRGDRQYTVDPVGRVTAVRAASWTERYAYDPAGNVTEANDENRDCDGTLVRRAGRTTYRHDGQGRVIRKTVRTLSGQERTWQYTWDGDDRLTEVATPDGATWRYRYDPLGRRVAKQRFADDGTPGEETLFTWDGTVLAEQLTVNQDGSATVRTWDYKPGTYQPVGQTDRRRLETQADYDAEFYAIITDLVGTPVELVDNEGQIAWQTTTDVWGRPIEQSDADGTECPLRFPGQYHDEETGWHYNYTRYYDPESAQYTSPDPLGLEAAPNQHGYVDNPLVWTDTLGLKTDDELLADAWSIHDAIRIDYPDLPGGDIAHNGMTVAVGEFNGQLVYTVSNNRTSPAVRETAERLGYERINGKRYTGPNQTDAEQIMLNAHDQGRVAGAGRIAPSRPACGPIRQDCRGRIAGYPNITLIE
jgi:RHS repeat-associated protein